MIPRKLGPRRSALIPEKLKRRRLIDGTKVFQEPLNPRESFRLLDLGLQIKPDVIVDHIFTRALAGARSSWLKRLLRFSLHREVCRSISGHGKTESRVERSNRIVPDDLQTNNDSPTVCLVRKAPQQGRPDPLPLEFRQQVELAKVDVVRPPPDLDGSNVLAVQLNNIRTADIPIVSMEVNLNDFIPSPNRFNVAAQRRPFDREGKLPIFVRRGSQGNIARIYFHLRNVQASLRQAIGSGRP